MNFVEPIRDAETVRELAERLKAIDEKYYILFMVGIYSGLRVSDILTLRVRDVKNHTNIKIREQKTGKEKIFPINAELKKALKTYCEDKRPAEWLIPSARNRNKPVSREYVYRVIHRAGEDVGLDNLGTHTMRKTFGYHFYMQTKDIVLLMKILNHTDQSKTLRYIGIEQTTINEAMRKFSYKKSGKK